MRILAVAASAFVILHGLSLYNRGMYERAREVFTSLSEAAPDAIVEGYALLCDLQLNTEGCDAAVERYETKYGKSALYSDIHYLNAVNLFDAGEYSRAKAEFVKVSEKKLGSKKIPELYFKTAYCDYQTGDYESAKAEFLKMEPLHRSDYTAPARYALGYIYYSENNFNEAYTWFDNASSDTRFADNCKYYMLECRFMEKDYQYVSRRGDEIYNMVPAERKPHLARILSESFLILGDTAKAKEYYDANALTGQQSRSDYFYAGSLQYALKNYQEAIDNYTMMTMRTDSIGQIANYQLGYSYIQIKNKVLALESFQQAASVTYDKNIREDAFFNYAKLAFDINNDPSPFSEYLSEFAKSSGKGEQIYGYMALTALANRDYEGAVNAYDQIDELDAQMRGNYMKANYLRANQLVKNGSYRDAIPYLRASTFFTDRQDNFNQLARYWLAEAQYKTENYEEAQKVYENLYNLSALDRQEEGKYIPYNLAYSYFKAEDYANAAKWFETYINSGHYANREDAEIRRADCDFLQQDYKNAVLSYNRVVEDFNDINKIYPYYQLGLSYGLLSKNADKIKALLPVKDADRNSSFYSEALYELGRTYVLTRKDADAKACFNQLKETSPDKNYIARSLIELGMMARNSSKNDEALQYYKEVIETMPASDYAEDALLAIESIYQSKGQTTEYLQYIGELNISKSDSEKENLYFSSAEQVFLAGNYEKAVVSLADYLETYPNGLKSAQANFYMAESYKNLGKKEKACDYYSKVANMSDGGSFAELSMLNFADLSYSLERYSDSYGAYSSLLSVAKLDNNKQAAEVGMMRSAYKARSYQQAIKAAENVRKDYSENAELTREADLMRALSYLATSQRDKAFTILRTLASQPSTAEGAQASYLVIQDTYDQGNFDEVEPMVYKFSESAGSQSYWLAKAFIVLGDSFAEKENFKQARATFQSLLDGYESQDQDDDIISSVKMRISRLNDYE